jgi:hypothetical protein
MTTAGRLSAAGDIAPTITDRVLGATGVVGGVVLLAAFLPIQIPSDLNVGRLVLFNLGAIAVIVAVHRRNARVDPRWAWIATVPAIVANATHLVLSIVAATRETPFAGDFGVLYFGAGLAMWLSDAWFGFVTAHLDARTRWGAVCLAIGSLLAILGMDRLKLTSPGNPTVFGPLALTGIALNGLGWILLGIDLVRRAPEATRPG